MLYLGNTGIQSNECEFYDQLGKKGQKARNFCLDEKTLSVNNYNSLGEDPLCLRPYPSFARNHTSYNITNGDCVRVNYNEWVLAKISPYDGREWQYNPEWDDMYKYEDQKD